MDRSRLLFVALAVSIALLVPSGAWPYDPTGVDRPEEMADVELAPADGPNGEYAVLNGDDEIEILIGDVNPYVDADGVSQGSVSTAPHIFTITNTGSTAVSAWITHDVDALRYIRGDSEYESIEGRSNRATLGPNETVSVGLQIDARDDIGVDHADSFTVHASRIETDRPATDQSVSSGRDQSSVTTRSSASGKIVTTSPPVSDGAASDKTEAPPTLAGSDSQTATPTSGETDTPTQARGGISTPTTTVSAPLPASRQPPSSERNQSIASGFGAVSSSAMGTLIALLSLVVLLAVLQHVRRES